MIARSKGWNFVTANYPKAVLIDLEDVLSKVDGFLLVGAIPFVLQGIQNNIDFWSGPAAEWASSQTKMHDCVGITGAVLEDVVSRDAAYYQEQIEQYAQKGVLELIEKGQLGDLHIAITGRYALNPSNNPAYAKLSQLQWVDARQPRYLFVDIGHNTDDSSLFGSVFSGNPQVTVSNPAAKGFNRSLYVERMKMMVNNLLQLSKLPDQIFFSLLPKPSAVPNMEPNRVPIAGSGYFQTYWPAFSTSQNEFSLEQMAALDEAVLEANKQITSYISSQDTGNRFTIIDSYAVLEKYDYKHAQYGLRLGISIPVEGLDIDNNYVEGTVDKSAQAPRGLSYYKFLRGGFCSLDGCHPSAIGYSIYALEIMDILAKKFGTSPLNDAQRHAIVETAYGNESLVKPSMLRQVEMIRQYFNAFSSHPNPQETVTGPNAPTLPQVVHALKGVFRA